MSTPTSNANPETHSCCTCGFTWKHGGRLRIAHAGDYPGYPVAWINDIPLQEAEEAMLLNLVGITSRGRKGLRELLDQLGAVKTPGLEEHPPWQGALIIKAVKDCDAAPTPAPAS